MVYTLDILVTNIEQELGGAMATRGTVKEMAGLQEQSQFRAFLQGSTCVRCGGLMVAEFCMDLLNSNGELDCPVVRCVQCGDVVDPVIQRNRRLHHHTQASSSLGLPS